MTVARQNLGRRAEDLVARRLELEGWLLVERNARTRFGEIDMVALDGAVLVFAEVKAGRTGNGAGPMLPELAVGSTKQRRIRRLAAAWLADRPPLPPFSSMRFDVVGVSFDPAGQVTRWEHLRSAF
jgi:putative endonuclease